MNNICIVGRLTKTPEIKSVGAAGTQVAEFTVAVNKMRKDDPADFFSVKSWGKSAEYCAKYLVKGQRVSVSGRMESRKYNKDGVDRIFWEVTADHVNGLDKPGESGGSQPMASPEEYRRQVETADIEDPFAD